MKNVIEITASETAAQIERDEEPEITVQLPFTSEGHELLDSIDAATRVILRASDGPFFTGTVQDWDADRGTVTVALT